MKLTRVKTKTFAAKLFWVFCLILLLAPVESNAQDAKAESGLEELLKIVQPGDILFQDIQSDQSLAIKLATDSKYSHCGMILEHKGQLMVLEAVMPVRYTSIASWINRDDKQRFALLRLKKEYAVLTPEVLAEMSGQATSMLGKSYDIYFNWSDQELYCSELVWKIYQRAMRLELCPLRELRSYNLESKIVRYKLEERYGKNIPLDEKMVAPEDIFLSNKLEAILVQ